MLAMKKLVIFLLVVVVVVGGVGYWRGWFTVDREAGGPKVHVDPEKFKKDRTAFSKMVSTKAKEMKESMAKLLKKAEGLSGEEKTKTEKELKDLEAKHDELEKQIKELDQAGEDKFEDIKHGLGKQLEEVVKKMDTLTKKLETVKDKKDK
jgi:chromosome segregation ATPase